MTYMMLFLLYIGIGYVFYELKDVINDNDKSLNKTIKELREVQEKLNEDKYR